MSWDIEGILCKDFLLIRPSSSQYSENSFCNPSRSLAEINSSLDDDDINTFGSEIGPIRAAEKGIHPSFVNKLLRLVYEGGFRENDNTDREGGCARRKSGTALRIKARKPYVLCCFLVIEAKLVIFLIVEEL